MTGTSLTHYRITARLGEGGMGEVYRATDTKLGREVAIKVLPASISLDAQSLARFEREAKALATLNHPNVAAIHGFDADRETHFIVLELVEGDTLNQRLRRGPLPVDEALRVARQIAEAVEAAHAKGIIHRDLKPGNVKITPEGRVKVLDFGLAKLQPPVAADLRRLTSQPGKESEPPHVGCYENRVDADAPTQVQPTVPVETTTPGVVLGTPAYMSPEQARGQEVDKRTDVWAFGCCLFECLSGSKPFAGQTVTDMMAAVLKSEPDWSALPAETPREVATLVRRCLEKDPRRRLSSLGDIALLLEDSTPLRSRQLSGSAQTESKALAPPSAKLSFWHRFGPAFAALLGLALVGLAITGVALWRTPKAANQIRSLAVLPFEVNTPDPKLAGLEKWIPLEIVSKLGQVTNLQVVNLPTKIEQLVSQKKDADEIARELKVDGLVRGQLVGQGESMTVYVSVVDSTGRAVGKTQNLPASVSKISSIPNQVAEAVVRGLNVQLNASQRAEIQNVETKNSEAFLAYQRGRDLFSSRKFAEASAEVRRAYQLDPNYTLAWTALGFAELAPLIYGGTTDDLRSTFKRLSDEVEKFHAQRPNDAVVTALQMWIAMLYERDWNKVRTIYWKSQGNRNPDPGQAHVTAYYYTFIEGHPELAAKTGEQAIALDPENPISQIDHAYRLAYFGRYEEALREFRMLPPERIQLEDYSRVLIAVGDLAGAKDLATRILQVRPNAMTRCWLALIQTKSGAVDEARKLLRELEAQAEQGMHIPYTHMAAAYGALGEFETARRWLRKGLLEGRGDWSMLELRTAHRLEMFGKFPWYWEIIDELKFPPLQMDSPFFALEQAMRYKRGAGGELISTASTNEPPKTLAVLPFDKIGAGAADDDFNEGLTIELITLLQNVKGLQVQGAMSSMRFKGSVDPKQVGEQLKVDHLLQGKVRRSGDRLRIDVGLQKAADGFGLWATNYDRKLSDIFAIQTEVAQQVAEALKVKLGVEDQRALARQSTGNAEAYSLYLQGRAAWNRRTIPEFERATNFFNQSLQKDPNFALAHAGLADVHVIWPLYSALRLPGEHPKRVMEHAGKALQLDPTLAEPHAALGYAKVMYDWDWEGALREFQAAALLNPSSANTYHWHADALMHFGRYTEAIPLAEKSVRLDPSPINHTSYGYALIGSGQVDAGIDYLEKRVAQEPWFGVYQLALFRGCDLKGDYDKAEKAVAAAASLLKWREDLISAYQGYLLARRGKIQEARLVLKSAEASETPNWRLAMGWDAVGDNDHALAILEQSVRQREAATYLLAAALTSWKGPQNDPRFQAILRQLNMKK